MMNANKTCLMFFVAIHMQYTLLGSKMLKGGVKKKIHCVQGLDHVVTSISQAPDQAG